MARISYDDQTASAYKQVREVPRPGLAAWRDAVERHLRPRPGRTVVDIGAGTVSDAFSDAGFRPEALEPVPESLMTVTEFLERVDTFRRADTVMRSLTEDEYQRGKQRLRVAVVRAERTGVAETRTSWLDLLVLC